MSQYWIRNSNVQDGGSNYLLSSIENSNERNIQRTIWEATEKATKSYQWEFWSHHDGNKESSEWYKWGKIKSPAYRDSAGRKIC